jgi:hypothetical protein
MIGIFWILPAVDKVDLLAHTLTLDEAETYGDCLTCPLSHIDAWEATKRGAQLLTPLATPTRIIIVTSEYEEWPRGRVVFERAAQRFVVYADRHAFTYAKKIRKVFHLPGDALFRTDLHYGNVKRLSQKRHFQPSHNADFRLSSEKE